MIPSGQEIEAEHRRIIWKGFLPLTRTCCMPEDILVMAQQYVSVSRMVVDKVLWGFHFHLLLGFKLLFIS